MKAFLVKTGTNVLVTKKDSQESWIKPEKKITIKDTVFYLEDLAVDPLGNVASGPKEKTPAGSYARGGFYGFRLKKNSKGYDVMIVHSRNVVVK